jgi:hypothetical protein
MNRKDGCGCSGKSVEADIGQRRPGSLTSTAVELLRDRPFSREFSDAIREGSSSGIEEALPVCFPIGVPGGEIPTSQIPGPVIDDPIPSGSFWEEYTSGKRSRVSYLTEWQLDLTAVPHMTRGLAQLSGARLAGFANNNFGLALNQMARSADWIDAGPDRKSGIYTNSDGSLRIRFVAVQKSNLNIDRRELESGRLRFSADQMLFVVLVERGNLNPTRCIRFVQVKRGFIRLYRNNGGFEDVGPSLRKNKLFETWTIDDSSEPRDLQLGTKRRRDGLVTTSTCDTPGVTREQTLRFQWRVEYSVEFILYIVSCCCGTVEGEESDAASGMQILFALPWEVKIQGSRPIAGRTIEPRYRQRMGEVVVAPPDHSLIPVINDVVSPEVCKKIRLEKGGSPCS